MIKKILNKLFYNPYRFVNKHKHLVTVGDSILTKQFRIDFSAGNKNFVNIGDRCILECNLIFEKDGAGISVGSDTYIGPGTQLISINKISIGKNVQISWDVTVYDHNGYSLDFRQRRIDYSNTFKNFYTENRLIEFDWESVKSNPITIEDDAWIGFGATILKGVTIGKGAIVAANSVVTKDVEPLSVVMGNPAKKVRQLNDVK